MNCLAHLAIFLIRKRLLIGYNRPHLLMCRGDRVLEDLHLPVKKIAYLLKNELDIAVAGVERALKILDHLIRAAAVDLRQIVQVFLGLGSRSTWSSAWMRLSWLWPAMSRLVIALSMKSMRVFSRALLLYISASTSDYDLIIDLVTVSS